MVPYSVITPSTIKQGVSYKGEGISNEGWDKSIQKMLLYHNPHKHPYNIDF